MKTESSIRRTVMKKRLLTFCLSVILAACLCGLGITAWASEEGSGPSAGAVISYELSADEAVSATGVTLDSSVEQNNMKLNVDRNELNIAGDFTGWVAYTLQMDAGYAVETLTLDWTGRLACYMASSTTKLVISVSKDGGAYQQVSSADGTPDAVSSGQETLTELTAGASVVSVKFEIIWTGTDSRDWMGIGTVRLSGTGVRSESTLKVYSLNDNYTEQVNDGAVPVSPEGKNTIVEQQNMMFRSSDGSMHLQINPEGCENTTGYIIYRLSAGNNYGFKNLNMTIQADRISNFEGSGTITLNVYAKEDGATDWTQIGEPFVADGSKTSLNYDLTSALQDVSDALVKYEIVYAGMASYSHDWVRLNAMSFSGSVDIVPVEYSFIDDYAQYTAEGTVDAAEECTLILRTSDEDVPAVRLQRPTDSNIRTGYIVYKMEVPNGGTFDTMALTIHGRFLHDISAGSSGSIIVNVYTKIGAEGEYVKAYSESFQDCNKSVLQADLTEEAADNTTVYVKIEIVDESGVSFSHDWVRFNDIEIRGTQTFVPYDDDGVERFEIAYDKGGDDVIGKTPVQKEPLKEGDELTLPVNPFKKTGYSFLGWKADTDNKIYEAGEIYTMGASNVTFTAQWEKISYTVTIESGLPEDAEITGTLPDGTTLYMGDEFTFPEVPISASGYEFVSYIVTDEAEIDKIFFAPGDTYTMNDYSVIVSGYWRTSDYDGPVLDLSDEKYEFMGEFAANINYKNTELATEAYESYNIIQRTNDDGTASGIQLPQGSKTSQGYVTWALYAGDGLVFDELYFKFSGRIAFYESVSRAAGIDILVSDDNQSWTLSKSLTGAIDDQYAEFDDDFTAFAGGKSLIYVKVLFKVENFPTYGAEWVQISAAEFSGLAKEGGSVAPADKITVTYYDGTSVIKTEQLDKGASLTPADAPEKKGYVFRGWYTDSACKNEFKDGASVTENLSLYAKYEEKKSGGCKGTALGSFAGLAVCIIGACAVLLIRKKRA